MTGEVTSLPTILLPMISLLLLVPSLLQFFSHTPPLTSSEVRCIVNTLQSRVLNSFESLSVAS